MSLTRCLVVFWLAGLAWLASSDVGVSAEARVTISESAFDFKTVAWDDPVEHTFYLENAGQDTVDIANIRVTAPLFFKNVRKRIPPGGKEPLTIVLRTPRPAGAYEGAVEVSFANPEIEPLELKVTGTIIPPIEISPRPVFFVSTFRGESSQASLTIINHEKQKLEIERVKSDSARFSVSQQPVEPGEKYVLTLSLKGEGPSGRAQDEILLFTSSKVKPVLTIQANTLIKERVYTFPDAVNFGRLRITELGSGPDRIKRLTQTLMVYQNKGTNFQVKAMTDLPFLELKAEPSKFGDRYEITAQLNPEHLPTGEVKGNIGLQTNDRDFPLLNIPVTAFLDGNAKN